MTAIGLATENAVMGARELLSRFLRQAFPKCTAKCASAAAGGMISHRTVEDYLQKRSEPTVSVLLAWAHNPKFRAELKGLLEDLDHAEARLLADLEGQTAFDFSPRAEVARSKPIRDPAAPAVNTVRRAA